ncbi:MAG: phage tail protein [Roseburia sp.]|nr:phage tail protein [Roseburia sp.]
MVVGKFGKYLTFEVCADSGDSAKCLTFENFQREVTNQTTDHARILMKQKVQFNGPALSTMSFSVRFSSSLGVNPRKMLKQVESCVRLGKVGYVVIGKEKIGKHKYLITSASESWDNIIKDGKLISANVDLTLKEYL